MVDQIQYLWLENAYLSGDWQTDVRLGIDAAGNIASVSSGCPEVSDERIKGTTIPVVWKKKYGKGRIFYTSLGHNIKVFEIPEAMTIMKRGILWAIGELD